MMVSLACLQERDCSKVLFNLLTVSNNIADSLPEKFVYHLLSKRKGRNLHLCPQIVAEAFMSVDDPLLIVSSGMPDPKINAPDAIFVDLKKSKKEITSALFLRKAAVCCQFPSNDDECETILEAPYSNTSSNVNVDVNPKVISVDLDKPEQIISKLRSTRKAYERDDYCETISVAPSSSNTSSNANVHVNPVAECKEKKSDDNDECRMILEVPSSSNTSSNANVHSNPKKSDILDISLNLGDKSDDNKKLILSFLEQLQPPSAVEELKRVILSMFEESDDEANNPPVRGGKKKAMQAVAKSGVRKKDDEQAKSMMNDAFVESVCKKLLEEGSSKTGEAGDEEAKSMERKGKSKTCGADEEKSIQDAKTGKGKSKNKKGKKKKN
uniref:uncharacterized protein LOC122586106 n=1 Tax=Erigeron canadensis TaxID=72917 RepID=UPI001CB8B691|nr:uncharacterized protein LOC122586106 [Erigeron canadensis]